MHRFLLITTIAIIATVANFLFSEAADKEEIRYKLREAFLELKAEVQNITDSSVTLVWTCHPTYIDGFRIRIIKAGNLGILNPRYTHFLPKDATLYTVDNLEASTEYSFTIEARDSSSMHINPSVDRFYSSNILTVTTKYRPLRLPRNR